MKKTKLILAITTFCGICLIAHADDTNPPPPPGGDSADNVPDVIPPERPARPELTSDLKDKLSTYQQVHDALRDELKALIKAEEKPTREKIREITLKFEADNQDRLEQQKQLAREIKAGLQDSRPTRPSKPEVSDRIKTKINLLRVQHDSIQQTVAASKQALKTQLESATTEQRKEILDTFRQEQKQLHDELKNIQRQIRETLLPALDATSSTTRPERRQPPTREEVDTGDRRTTDR